MKAVSGCKGKDLRRDLYRKKLEEGEVFYAFGWLGI